MDQNWLLLPPIAFVVVLLASVLLSLFSSRLAFKSTTNAPGKGKSYACGEDVPCPRVQPEYGQFFPFAFFFTIMHVVALVVATAPQSAIKGFGIAFVYIIAAFTALLILFRK